MPRLTLLALLLISVLALLATPSAGLTQPEVRYFPETKHTVRGRFLQYWLANGGLAQQGFPLTEEFQEVNKLDGQTYTVQYFERAVFELHPENQPPHDVLLSQLGRFELEARYPNNSNSAARPVSDADGKVHLTPAAGAEAVTRSGRGNQKTDSFRLSGGSYKIAWIATDTSSSRAGCHLGGFLHSVDADRPVSEPVANEGIPGGGSLGGSTNAYNLPAANYYLDMSSGCTWTVTITKQ